MKRKLDLDGATAARIAKLALDCVHREFPNRVAHTLASDADVLPPRELTPAFYGCYDWHSAVHGHWLLARLARAFPDEPFARRSRAALARTLTAENIARWHRSMVSGHCTGLALDSDQSARRLFGACSA